MPFRIRKDAKKWFKHIDKDNKEKGFNTDFDILYFCFMAGITARRKTDVAQSEATDMIDYFPDRYTGDRGRLLIALFLARELEELGITMSEKKVVHREISRLISPDSQNYLSSEGLREFNRYVHGGFEVLLDWFNDQPRTLETFLQMYKRKVDVALESQ